MSSTHARRSDRSHAVARSSRFSQDPAPAGPDLGSCPPGPEVAGRDRTCHGGALVRSKGGSKVPRDFHRRPFDEGTKVKLDLFGAYTREWLPVWLSRARPGVPITVADFFAGPGYDADGVPGSPLMLLSELRDSAGLIASRSAEVRLILNEAAKPKADALRATIASEAIPDSLCKCEVRNLDFDEALDAVYPSLERGPNLLILDQQGMKEISDDVFVRILKLERTDFLFFIASSSIRRFESHPAFQRHLKIPEGAISGAAFNDTHRQVTQYYRNLAKDNGAECFVGSFSIKKGSNIYGVIFGSHHPLGLEKFLRACWKADPDRGEANFDIDEEGISSSTPHLFPEMDKPKKLMRFHDALREKILGSDLGSDRAVYLETLQEGFLPAHGREVVRELVKSGKVKVVGGQARVSKAGYAEPRRLEVIEDV